MKSVFETCAIEAGGRRLFGGRGGENCKKAFSLMCDDYLT